MAYNCFVFTRSINAFNSMMTLFQHDIYHNVDWSHFENNLLCLKACKHLTLLSDKSTISSRNQTVLKTITAAPGSPSNQVFISFL